MATVEEKRRELALRQQKVQLGGGEKRIAQQHAKGKQTAQERLGQLFDAGTFVELDQFVTHRCVYFGMDQKELPGEGVVTGYGTIEGRLVYAFAQDFTVEGGSLGEMHAAKICKVLDLAMKMGAPVVGINDSGGARIQEAVDAMSGYGQIFRRNTHASGLVPQISVIMGPCAGGAVYSPALTDFIYMVEKESQMFITGPAVIKAVTAEEVTGEQLGGTLTHNAVSGVAHFKAADEADCIAQIRRLLRFLPSNNLDGAPLQETADPDDRMEAQLNLLLPDHPNQPYDMKEVISRIVDDADFYEVHEHFARNIITCFARFGGQAAGIIANQPSVMAGCLDINASDKAARFIRFCDAFNLPVVNLIDVPGFLPGTDQEYGGIIRHGAKMLYAYSEATVPKVSVILRKAYGGSYIAMCSQDLGADQVLAWPTAEIAVMGPAGAANIIFRKDADVETKTKKYVEEFSTPYKAAERGFVDRVIEPRETRPNIINALRMLKTKRESRPPRKHGNIPL